MVSLYIIAVSGTTVFKIVFTVVCGIVLSPYLSEPKKSEKGFSFIAVRIMLPCMLFGNLCLDISLDLISQYYWAVIMSFVPMLLGALASFLCFGLVSREYRVLIMLGSTFQNGLLFPLSVVTNIRGIAWLDDKAVNECQQYVFLYNLCCALGLWSIGGPMIKYFKDKVTQEHEDAAEELYYERRQQRNMKRFVKELKERSRKQRGQAEKAGKAEQRTVADAAEAGHGDAPRAATAEVGSEISGGTKREDAEAAQGRQVAGSPSQDPANPDQGEQQQQHSPPASSPKNGKGPAQGHDADDDSLTNDIIAQYRRHFAPHQESGVVFPQLLGPTKTDGTASAPAAPPPTAITVPTPNASASPTTTRYAQSHHPSSKRVGREENEQEEEVLLGADARPTVQGQLHWYRPARRAARPIDVSKFDRWKALSQAKQGQGPQSTLENASFTNTQSQLPPELRLALGADAEVDADGPVAFPPALGEGIYSDNTVNLPNTKTRTPSKEEAAARRARLDPREQAEAAAAEAFRYSDVHTLDISPPSTPPPENGQDVLVHAADDGCAYYWRRFKGFFLFAVQTPPVYITLLAILVSTLPPLRWCAQTFLGLSAIKGIALVGTACVPFQLVALGCSLSAKKDEAAPLVLQEDLVSEDENTSGDDTDEGHGGEGESGTARKAMGGATEQQQQQQQKGGDPPLQVADAVTGDAILASQPAFNVAETMADIAARTEREGQKKGSRGLVVVHGTSCTPASDTLSGQGKDKGEGGHISTRKMQKQLRNIALRRKREMLAAMGAVRRFWYRIPDATRFTFVVLFLRLLLLPALAFLMVHWLIRLGIMPLDRPFIVSILIGVSSPAAVNASLLCTFNDYHAGDFSRMIFMMYCLAAVTSTLWLALSISYTSAFVPDKVIPSHPEDW